MLSWPGEDCGAGALFFYYGRAGGRTRYAHMREVQALVGPPPLLGTAGRGKEWQQPEACRSCRVAGRQETWCGQAGQEEVGGQIDRPSDVVPAEASNKGENKNKNYIN